MHLDATDRNDIYLVLTGLTCWCCGCACRRARGVRPIRLLGRSRRSRRRLQSRRLLAMLWTEPDASARLQQRRHEETRYSVVVISISISSSIRNLLVCWAVGQGLSSQDRQPIDGQWQQQASGIKISPYPQNNNNNNNNDNNNNQEAANKIAKYYELASTHIFYLVVIETGGTWNRWAVELVQEIGRQATLITGEPTESTFLFQQFSVAL